jgi:hypothetical protein
MGNHLLMNEDDPEKRTADLDQLTEQKRDADLPPVQPPRLANVARGTGSGRRSSRNVLAALGLALFAIFGLSDGVNDFRGYSHGTPTTATVSRCGGKPTNCDGTWSIDGVSQTGLIEPGFHTPPVGSTKDVRVSNGKAYLAGSWLPSFTFGGFFLVGSIGALVGGRSRTDGG